MQARVDTFLDGTPLWLLAVAFLLMLTSARAAGTTLHNWRQGRWSISEGDSEEGYILSGVLGLLALLIAFTFSLALDRYEQRRDLVVAEANALGTFSLRAELLSDSERVDAYLLDYAEVRLAYGQQPTDIRHETRQSVLQKRLWDASIRALGEERNGPLATTVLQPLNEAFDLAGARKAERAARLPASVLIVLLLYSVIAAGVVGFAVSRSQLRLVSYMLFALLTLSIALVVDLDQPQRGSIQVPQAPMQDFVRGLREPAK